MLATDDVVGQRHASALSRAVSPCMDSSLTNIPFEPPRPPAAAIPGAVRQTEHALETMKDSNRFEDLVVLCLQDLDPTLRPTGGPGDRQRDAVTGALFLNEKTVLTISLDGRWASKARRDLAGLKANPPAPERVIVVSNRRTSPRTRNALQDKAPTEYGMEARVLDQRFLALRLLRQDLLHVRAEFLSLPLPASPIALEAEAYAEKLASTASRVDAFYGRDSELAALLAALRDPGTVALEGPGGVGKTRIALEAASRLDARTLFVDDRSQLSRNELPVELSGADHLILVVDNAHRRDDLRELVGLLEQRAGQTNLLLIARPGFDSRLIDAVDGSVLGPLDKEAIIELRPLPNTVIGDIVRNAQPELKYGGAIDRAIGIAQGNPLLALLAHRVAVEGGALNQLGQAEVLAAHAQSLVRSLVTRTDQATEHEVVELLAIIAALTYLDLDELDLQAAVVQLSGISEIRLRRLLHDFADAGIVTQSSQRFAITPDILSAHILWISFFANEPTVALRYETLWGRTASHSLSRLCDALGGLPTQSVTAEDPIGRFIAQELLGRAKAGEQVLDFIRAIAPAMPWLAAQIVDTALEHLPDEPRSRSRALVAAAEALERTPSFEEGWPRQLSVAASAFAGPEGDESEPDQAARTRITEGLTKIYTRLPHDLVPHEGQILAGVQQEMVDATTKFWRRHRDMPGAAEAIAIASRQLLTVTFGNSYTTAEHQRTLQLNGFSLPASSFTRKALFAGTRLFSETLPLVSLQMQMKQAETLGNLTRASRQLYGVFSARPSSEMAAMAREAQADLISRLADLTDLPIAVRATLEDELGSIWPNDKYLAEFHDLLSMNGGHRRRDSLDEPGASQRIEDMARRIVEADDPAKVLDRWAAWLDEAQKSSDRHWSTHTIMGATRAAAALDPALLANLLDDLLQEPGPLTAYIIGALALTFERAENAEARARKLITSEHEQVRAVAARAIGESSLAIRIDLLAQLVQDPSSQVRSAVQVSLVNRASPTQTELDLALHACLPDDVDGLTHILWRIDRGDPQPIAELSPEVTALVHQIVLGAARKDRLDGYDLRTVFGYMKNVDPRLPIDFARARIEHLLADKRPRDLNAYMRLDSLPDEIRSEVSAAGTDDDLRWTLDLIEDTDSSSTASGAIRELLEWLDEGPIVTERIAAWFASGNERLGYEAHRALDHRLPPDAYRERARMLLAAGISAEIEDEIIGAREPRMWSGTRHRYWRSLRDEFAAWLDDPDEAIAGLGRAGVAHYERRLEHEPGHDPLDDLSPEDDADEWG